MSRPRWLSFDYVLTGVIVVLLVACPFAFGAVHRWAYTTVEIVVFSLVAGWLVLGIMSSGGLGSKCNSQGVGTLFAAAMSFLVLIGAQLIPMPPSLLKIVSPQAYALYFRAPTGFLEPSSARASNDRSGKSSVSSATGAKSSSVLTPVSGKNSFTGGLISKRASWHPASIAPALTTYALVEAFAYTSFFFLVVTYRFDFSLVGETRFVRSILIASTICGVLLAVTGIIEQAYWNGKILWFFVPYDWGIPRYASFPRASGPFVNPDHFANYLGMIFPLTAGCTLFGLPGNRPNQYSDRWISARVLFGLASFLILLAITLSLSRAIWLLTGLGIIAFGVFGPYVVPSPASSPRPKTSRHIPLAVGRRRLWSVGAALTVSVLLLLLLGVFIGASHDNAVAERIGHTTDDPDLGIGIRPALWIASFHMLKDYPLTGIGLGTWGEIFPHYELPPRPDSGFYQAHDDYLQFIAEAGLLGLIPLIVAIVGLVHLSSRIKLVSYDRLPVLLSLCIAMAVMFLHELVDFAMHITANALLLTLLLALAIRLVVAVHPHRVTKVPVSWLSSAAQLAFVVGMYMLLVWLASSKQNLGYPADLGQPDSVIGATGTIAQHPASAIAYMDRFVLSGASKWPAADISDLASAVWLDPTNPYDRDLYASALDEKGVMPESLQAITASMFNSPDISSHYYLEPVLLKRLNLAQRKAVQNGLAQAATANESGAIPALAWIHETLGDFGDEAMLYESIAKSRAGDFQRSEYYDLAGRAWIKVGHTQDALKDFNQAVASDPSGTQAYGDLLTTEVAEKESFASVDAVVESAVNQGSNPIPLWTVLASAYQNAGDTVSAEKAFLNAVNLDPSYELLMRTGQFYLTNQRFDLAAAMFRRAIEVDPNSGAAYYGLGASNEGAYEYFQAEQAYGKAAQLSPADYRPRYEEFKKRMALAGQVR